MKFGRLFSIYVEGQVPSSVDPNRATVAYTIVSPLTVRFRISNTGLYGGSQAVFLIYNLTEDKRAALYKDIFEIFTYRQIVFSAGYSADSASPGAIVLPVVFQGNVTQASSYRMGPDWITEIHAMDGMFAKENGTVNLTKPAPYRVQDLLTDIVNQMPRVTLGLVSAFDEISPGQLTNDPGQSVRGITVSGNPWDIISRTVNPLLGVAAIRKEVVYIVQQWEFIEDEGQLEEISAETGLLDTPRLQDNIVKARMMFEPRIELLQKIGLKTLEARMNGDYVALQINHVGTISGAVCEDLITEVTLYQPERALAAAS